MTDIRTRLTDALRQHSEVYDRFTEQHVCICEMWAGADAPEFWEHVAEAVLSLPDVAIVELPEPKRVKPGMVMLHDGWVSARRARELAADLLAGAVAAESHR